MICAVAAHFVILFVEGRATNLSKMYHFRITKEEKGGFRFELDGIKILVDDYKVINDEHIFTNPAKAVAFFDVENNLYGISNEPSYYRTAEEFYDAMSSQFYVFTHA